MVSKTGWSRRFEDPIPLPGRQLVTLQQAADYIMKLPKAEQDAPEWQTAIGSLIGATEGRDFPMRARVGMLRALNRHVERKFADRKNTHWEKKKFALMRHALAPKTDFPIALMVSGSPSKAKAHGGSLLPWRSG